MLVKVTNYLVSEFSVLVFLLTPFAIPHAFSRSQDNLSDCPMSSYCIWNIRPHYGLQDIGWLFLHPHLLPLSLILYSLHASHTGHLAIP